MSTYVVDCSVVASCFMPDEKTEKGLQLFKELQVGTVVLIAPPLLSSEITNVLKNNIVRGRITQIAANNILRTFLKLPIIYVQADLEVILRVALEYQLSVYDAQYLALAMVGNTLLLTFDEKLVSAYSTTAKGVSEPVPEYFAGVISRKTRQKQIERLILEGSLLLKKKWSQSDALFDTMLR